MAATGHWLCLDEMNRVDYNVLSTVAAKILTVQQALQQQKQKITSNDWNITLNQNCAIFVTLNPEYAGRNELPANLKALFRPISLVKPDYKEILLV